MGVFQLNPMKPLGCVSTKVFLRDPSEPVSTTFRRTLGSVSTKFQGFFKAWFHLRSLQSVFPLYLVCVSFNFFCRCFFILSSFPQSNEFVSKVIEKACEQASKQSE